VSDQQSRETTNDRRVGVLLLLGLSVLFGGLYVAGYYFTSDKVPNGTTVAGVQVGGLTPAAAERTLAQGLRQRIREPIVVSAAGQRASIDPVAAGFSVDAAESVAQAGGGRSWSPARMWDYFAGGDSYTAVVNVDHALLEASLDPLAAKVDRPAMEGRVSLANGRAEPILPKVGRAVDVAGAAMVVADSFLGGGEVVPVPVEEIEPQVTEAEVRAAMNDFVNPAMSAPVVIDLGGERVVLRPEAYSSAISVENKAGELVPTLDSKALLRGVRPALRSVTRGAREATVKLVEGRPKVIPSKDGVTFDRKEITDEFLSLLVAEGNNRTLEVSRVRDRPEFTTADARELGIRRGVSSFTTYYPHSDYRNTNIGRAAQLVNGTLLKPGETFSLNDTVGERTAANGFVKGLIISYGIFEEDFGGGVSQVATTLFNAAFFAGLKDVEHKPHSFYIDRYPIGREATVAWGLVDLRFKNKTPHGILIQAGIEPSSPVRQGAMTVKMWSTKHWDIEASVSERYNFTKAATRIIDDKDCTPNEGYGGVDVDVYRYFRKPDSDRLVRRETFHTTYTPSDTVICQ